jgi:hypothetical protein
MIIPILLHEDGVDVIDMAVRCSVVVGGDHNANWKLFIFADGVFLFVVCSFRVNDVIYGIQLEIFGLPPTQGTADLTDGYTCVFGIFDLLLNNILRDTG